MPKRSEKRDTAKAEYVKRKSGGGQVNLKELAAELGVSYQTVRNWKNEDKWDMSLPKKKRGAQPGNRNCTGHKNATGHHEGAPKGNKNAEKDGAYSAIFFDMLTDSEKEIAEGAPLESREALEHEMKILKVREHRILEKIAQYEAKPEDSLFLNTLLDMRIPGKKSKKPEDGKNQQMGMYSKDSAFARVLKLQEALYKVQGRIASIANSMRAAEENSKRIELENRRLEIMMMRATGTVEVADPDGNGEGELEE